MHKVEMVLQAEIDFLEFRLKRDKRAIDEIGELIESLKIAAAYKKILLGYQEELRENVARTELTVGSLKATVFHLCVPYPEGGSYKSGVTIGFSESFMPIEAQETKVVPRMPSSSQFRSPPSPAPLDDLSKPMYCPVCGDRVHSVDVLRRHFVERHGVRDDGGPKMI